MLFQIEWAQGQVMIKINSVEQTDRTFEKNDELFLENRATRHEVIFILDTIDQKLKTDKYLIETYYSVWDGDTTIEEKIVPKYTKWKNEISPTKSKRLLLQLKTDSDILQKDISFLHTSHHYFNIYIDVIQNKDTIHCRKTKPFTYLFPWRISEPEGTILNPKLDHQLYKILPKTFLGRKKLKPLRFKQ